MSKNDDRTVTISIHNFPAEWHIILKTAAIREGKTFEEYLSEILVEATHKAVPMLKGENT